MEYNDKNDNSNDIYIFKKGKKNHILALNFALLKNEAKGLAI